VRPAEAERPAAALATSEPSEVVRHPGANRLEATKSDLGTQAEGHRIEVTLAGRCYAVTYRGEALGVFREPLCDASRILTRRGRAVEADRLILCRNGVPAMSGSVGWCARHTVEESERVGPRWAKHRAFDLKPADGLQAVDGAAQEAQVDAAAPPVPETCEAPDWR
jgi:hypothetical protein